MYYPTSAVACSEMGMLVHEQHYVMKNFRSGAFNLLVATSVAEEGYALLPLTLTCF